MRTRRILAPLVAAALALLCLLPTIALAADVPDVTGTVTLDGTPVDGAAVTVVIEGGDMAFSAVSDATGAWSVVTGVQAGQTLTISALSPTTRTSPDGRGCVTVSATSGRVSVVVDALPVAPVTVALDTPVVSTVCSATATPQVHPTPPATDAGSPARSGAGAGVLLLAMGLAAVALLAVGPVRRPSRRR